MSVIINPGSGPVADATVEQAPGGQAPRALRSEARSALSAMYEAEDKLLTVLTRLI